MQFGVPLVVVPDALEAEMICGLLRTNGIPATHRKVGIAAGLGSFTGGALVGPVEVLVAEEDLARARELLPS